ncbi:MAG: TonB-dependent receptor [Gemmatimonadetes bacterium]|nr:TonB-dependent receptor [Gemmatimonadota bacterium]
MEQISTFGAAAHGSYGLGSGTGVAATLNLGGGSSTGHPLGGGEWMDGGLRASESRQANVAVRGSHAVSPDLKLDGRIGLQESRVSHTSNAAGLGSVPMTWLADDGLSLGMLPGGDSEVRRRSLFASLSAEPSVPGLDALRVGAQVRYTNFDYRHLFGSGGEFFLASGAGPALQGRYVESVEPAAFRRYGRFDAALFGDFQVPVTEQLDLGVGLRLDWESFNNPALGADSTWAQLSGVVGSDFLVAEDRVLNGFLRADWRPESLGPMSLHGVVGVRHGETDPALLNEVHRTGPGVVRQIWDGDFPEWPNVTGAPTGEAIGLSLLGPGFSRPRTLWALVGATRNVGGSVWFTLTSGLRQTDFLPRRIDLNAVPVSASADQFGRPLFGTVQARGGWMGPEFGSNRRFLGYESVWMIDSDGWSHHVWGTIAMDARLPRLDIFGSLTLSQTEDNWLGAGAAHPEAARDPRLGPAVLDWSGGTSDVDVPIRAALSASVKPGGAMELTATYRFRSGRPFTPGFPRGVDANGDGSGLNDPAFVPEGQTLGALGQEWPCLADQAGAFAARNSCRGPSVQRLDGLLEISLPFNQTTLLLEALNLLDQGEQLVDGALWLLDGDPAVGGAGLVQIPYVLNPDFGQPVRDLGIGRLFRLGVRVGF